MLDFVRIACAVPEVRVADVMKNVEDICGQIKEADTVGSDLVIFPELALTGYTCEDLFFQESLLLAAMEGLQKVMDASAEHPGLTVVVGTPVILEGQMYNCGAVISGGKLHGLLPAGGGVKVLFLPGDAQGQGHVPGQGGDHLLGGAGGAEIHSPNSFDLHM